MSVSLARLVRVTVVIRGALGWAEPILTRRRRTVGDPTEVFIGIDVAKARNVIAVADGGVTAKYAAAAKSTQPLMR